MIYIIVPSYHHHIRSIEKHNTQYFYVETQVLGGDPQNPYNNSFPATTGRRKLSPYYNDFNSPATTGRRLQPPDLQATTWRNLQLPSSLATIGRRIQPHFLASSFYPNMEIEVLNHDQSDPVEVLINTCTTMQNLYHTTQPFHNHCHY